MSVFYRAIGRLADLIRRDRHVTYRAFIDARIVSYVMPLLDKIVAEGEDGDTLRNSLIPWGRAERPPLAIYRGDISRCRIDGPWQRADGDWLPLGGLIVTSGVTAHLDPFEARALHKRMEQAIEDTILAWVREHDLRSQRRSSEEIDRTIADPAAKTMIAAWSFGKREGEPVPEASPDRARVCPSGELGDGLCALCRKGSGHA